MIWSSRARNKSPDPVTSCFFGRMLPSAAATESRLPIRGNPRNGIASFRGLQPRKLAFSSRQIGGKGLCLSALGVVHGRLKLIVVDYDVFPQIARLQSALGH